MTIHTNVTMPLVLPVLVIQIVVATALVQTHALPPLSPDTDQVSFKAFDPILPLSAVRH